MTRGRRSQPVLWLRRYDVAVEAHPAHGYYVVGRRSGSKTVGEGYLQPNRILCRLELFFLPHDSARPGSSSCTSLIAGMPLL